MCVQDSVHFIHTCMYVPIEDLILLKKGQIKGERATPYYTYYRESQFPRGGAHPEINPEFHVPGP